MQAIVAACVETKSPVTLQVSSGARKYANQTILRYMAQGAVEYAKELGCNIPICLHLDHGDTYELCVSCIEMGFSSVMIDGSALPYDENVALTKKVVEYAHKYDVTVEGELGVLAGIEDDVVAAASVYTSPDLVEDFVKKTGVDSLAISIGTSHGANKFKPEQCTRNADGILVPPPLRSTSWKKSKDVSPDSRSFFTESSSVPQDKVAIINKYGFMETPYRKVDKEEGRVTDEIVYLTADEEDEYICAQANEPLDENGYFLGERVTARYLNEVLSLPPNQVDYMDVSPKMVFSVATA